MTFEEVKQAVTALEDRQITVSANALVAAIGGSKRDAVKHLRVLRAQPQAPVTPPACVALPVPHHTPTPPASRLEALRQTVRQLDEEWRDMERAIQHLQAERAQAHADLVNGRREVARLAKKVRQLAWVQTTPDAMLQQEEVVHQRAQLRDQLTRWVGAAEVERLLDDRTWRPWWLEG